MHPMTRSSTLLLPARVLGLVVAMWLGTQGVALVHGVMHRPVPAAALGTQHAVPGPAGEALNGHAGADNLFGHASGGDSGGLCQLFDQLAHADALWAAPAWAGPPAAPLSQRLGQALPVRCIPAAGAQARAPPHGA